MPLSPQLYAEKKVNVEKHLRQLREGWGRKLFRRYIIFHNSALCCPRGSWSEGSFHASGKTFFTK